MSVACRDDLLRLRWGETPVGDRSYKTWIAPSSRRNLKQVHVFGGKQVVNLMPEKAPNKGEALAAERDRLECNWVLIRW